jgi:hypothetical protein
MELAPNRSIHRETEARQTTMKKISVMLTRFCMMAWVLIGMDARGAFAAQAGRPIDVIEDNSFLIEEAYNQESGVVQHIFTAYYNNDSRRRGWEFNFTQEWPILSQDHQFSYKIPSYHLVENGDRQHGVGDIVLNYRYQMLDEGEIKPALAPRFSLILPSGSRKRGTGYGVVGYEGQLPFSKKLTGQLGVHANFGLTYFPEARAALSHGGLSSKHSLLSYNIGGSVVYALLARLHLMMEWLGRSEEDIDDNGKAKRAFKPILSPGFRTALVNQSELQIVTGAAVPIGLSRKADNYGVLLYFSVEHNFF